MTPLQKKEITAALAAYALMPTYLITEEVQQRLINLMKRKNGKVVRK